MSNDAIVSGRGGPLFSSAEAMAALSYLLPDVAAYAERPLADYAHAVYDVEARGHDCAVRREAKARLAATVVRVARRLGFGREDADSAGQQCKAFPVLQTGPHRHLVIEPDAFYSHLFSVMGLSAHARRWHISYSVSTVKFTEKAKKGPGWLLLEGEPVNVFGLSRSQMVPFSICGLNGPYHFAMSGRDHKEPANPSAARLKAMLPTRSFRSAAEAIEAANQALWHCFFPPAVQFLQFDDMDVADLIADHLEDATSWLARTFIGDGSLAERVLSNIDRLSATAWGGWIRHTTDFFWGLSAGRIFSLRLCDGLLVSQVGHAATAIRFRPADIAAALRERRLIPNMMTSFLVASILPGMRVLGGCRQTVYYPLMRFVYASALCELGKDNALLSTIREDSKPGLWGHRVLLPPGADPYGEIMAVGGTVSPLIWRHAGQSLTSACGNLASFTADPNWASLRRALFEGRTARTDPQWAYA